MDPLSGELPDLHRRAMDRFGDNVRQIRDDPWDRPTPCADWDVRALVNHVVNENRWTPPLIEGQTMADVGDRFDGDLLGDEPKLAWDESAREATASVHDDDA